MKVYAITAGAYSDYHIVAITDDKEKAEALASLINKQYGDNYGYGAAYAEEYDTKDVDIAVAHPNRKYFRVSSYASIDWTILCDEFDLDDFLQLKDERARYIIDDVNRLNDYWYFYCSARNQEQAIKKATDWVAQKKAKMEGVV